MFIIVGPVRFKFESLNVVRFVENRFVILDCGSCRFNLHSSTESEAYEAVKYFFADQRSINALVSIIDETDLNSFDLVEFHKDILKREGAVQ